MRRLSTLAAAKTCTLAVKFVPLAGGARSASVAINDNAAGSPQSLPLSGTGTIAQLQPASLSFGTVSVGSTGATMGAKLTNVGSVALNIARVAITGANPGDFTETTTCGASLAAGQAARSASSSNHGNRHAPGRPFCQ